MHPDFRRQILKINILTFEAQMHKYLCNKKAAQYEVSTGHTEIPSEYNNDDDNLTKYSWGGAS